MKITAQTKLCIIIGDPVSHSLSPQMHNAGYEKLEIEDKFVFVGALVQAASLADFLGGVKAMGIRGVSCTRPHKLEIMRYLDEIDEVASTIGAVNTVVNHDGHLKGYNTDWIGIVSPLETVTPLRGKKVALLGAGGAARAAAYGVAKRGAELTIYNRTFEKAQQLAHEFGGKACSLDNLAEISGVDIVINATPAGIPPYEEQTRLPKEFIQERHIVFDTVYGRGETRLLQEARQQGAHVIPGTEMLLHQGLAQFKLFTERDAPEEAMRAALIVALDPETT